MPTASTSPRTPGRVAAVWGSVAHDLRQPLQGLKLLTAVMANEDDAAARAQTRLRMETAVHSLQAMLERLSDLAVLEAQENGPGPGMVVLDHVLADIAAELADAAAYGGGAIAAATSGVQLAAEEKNLRDAVRGLAMHALWLDPQARIMLSAVRAGQGCAIRVETAVALPGGQPTRPALFTELPVRIAGTPALVLGIGYPFVAHLATLLDLELTTERTTAGGTAFVLSRS